MGHTQKKAKCNITRLRNQPKASPSPQLPDEGKFPDSAEPVIEMTDPQWNDDEILEYNEALTAHPDDARVHWNEEEVSECGDEDENIVHSGDDLEGETCRKGLQVRMFSLAIHCGDDPRDEDWVPPKLRKRHRAKKGSE